MAIVFSHPSGNVYERERESRKKKERKSEPLGGVRITCSPIQREERKKKGGEEKTCQTSKLALWKNAGLRTPFSGHRCDGFFFNYSSCQCIKPTRFCRTLHPRDSFNGVGTRSLDPDPSDGDAGGIEREV